MNTVHLEDTLVVWGGEFGRTSTSEQGWSRSQPLGVHDVDGWRRSGRGNGSRGNRQFRILRVQDKVHVHDVHATILHLLGLNHEKLTFRQAGRDYRLTDVYGKVVREILA